MTDRRFPASADIVDLPLARAVRRALERLKSLHDGDLGVIEITGCGKSAVPALRALLLEGEPSGIYQPRRRAVEALAALGAHDVLIEFLEAPREVADPVNRTGEEAVINAAARALIGVENPRIFPLLADLAERRRLPGVIEALGSFARVEALPHLVRALCEDRTRGAAETALLRMGPAARPTLLDIGSRPRPSAEYESASSVRTRRSAVRLLARSGAGPEAFRALMADADAEIALEACGTVLAIDDPAEKARAVRRLIDLLPSLPWFIIGEAERCLFDHFETARDLIAEHLQAAPPDPADDAAPARAYRSLLRVARRAGGAPL